MPDLPSLQCATCLLPTIHHCPYFSFTELPFSRHRNFKKLNRQCGDLTEFVHSFNKQLLSCNQLQHTIFRSGEVSSRIILASCPGTFFKSPHKEVGPKQRAMVSLGGQEQRWQVEAAKATRIRYQTSHWVEGSCAEKELPKSSEFPGVVGSNVQGKNLWISVS